MALDTAKATAVMRGLTARFDEGVRAAQPFYPAITTHNKSTGLNEQYAMSGAVPQMRIWDGDRNFEKIAAATQVVENVPFEGSMLVGKNDINDDRLGLYDAKMDELAARAATHPDELLVSEIETNTTLGFDGDALFSDTHIWGSSGTQDNNLGTTVSSTSAVTSAEFKASFLAARKQMLAFNDNQGKKLIQPTIGTNPFMVMVPLNLEMAAREALTATIISSTSNIVPDAGSTQIVVNTHLSSDVKWYLFHTGSALRPWIFQARAPLERQVKGINDLEEQDIKFMVQARYAIAPGAWWNAILTTMST